MKAVPGCHPHCRPGEASADSRERVSHQCPCRKDSAQGPEASLRARLTQNCGKIPPPNALTPQEGEVRASGTVEGKMAACLGTTQVTAQTWAVMEACPLPPGSFRYIKKPSLALFN